MTREPSDAAWEAGWDEHRDAQQRRFAQLSLVEKIRWLEEAQEIAEHIERSRKQQKPQP